MNQATVNKKNVFNVQKNGPDKRLCISIIPNWETVSFSSRTTCTISYAIKFTCTFVYWQNINDLHNKVNQMKVFIADLDMYRNIGNLVLSLEVPNKPK